jgi:hypothetical protein
VSFHCRLRRWSILYHNARSYAHTDTWAGAESNAHTNTVPDSGAIISFGCSFLVAKFFVRCSKLQRLPVISILRSLH